MSRWLPYLARLYPLCLGSLILMECTVHMRHFRNSGPLGAKPR